MAAAPPVPPGAPPYIPPTRLRFARATTTTLTIPARVGEKRSLEDIFVSAGANTAIDITVGSTTMLRLYNSRHDMVLVPTPGLAPESIGPLEWLRRVTGRTELIYAEEDEDITIALSATPTILYVPFFVDPSEKDKTRPFGSQSKERLFIAWVTHSATINATTRYLLDRSLSPTGLPAVVDGFVVPANYEYVLYGIIFASTKSGTTRATYLHILDESVELYTPVGREGILVDPDMNLLRCDLTTGRYFKLPEPYKFDPGHRIGLSFDAVYDGTNAISANTLYLGLVFLIRYLG